MSIIATATDAINTQLSGKPFYQSKTLWTNLIAIVGIGLQAKYGFIISADMQALALSVINLCLRAITKDPVTFS
jgi:hypothetical protein